MARILMVNDEPDLLTLCQETLQEDGHTVDVVMSGIQALDTASRVKPDLMIVDWVIPDMDGNALLGMLKARPSLSTIPVLAISALQDGAERAERAGADDFLQKPFGAEELLYAAHNALHRGTAGRIGK